MSVGLCGVGEGCEGWAVQSPFALKRNVHGRADAADAGNLQLVKLGVVGDEVVDVCDGGNRQVKSIQRLYTVHSAERGVEVHCIQ